MKLFNRSVLAVAVVGSFVVGCASTGADRDEQITARAETGGHVPEGVFKMYADPDHTPTGCDLYTELSLVNGSAGPAATLANRVGGACDIVANPNTRIFHLKADEPKCGARFFNGEGKDPHGAEYKIRISDYRDSTCPTRNAAPIVVEQTGPDGKKQTLYSHVQSCIFGNEINDATFHSKTFTTTTSTALDAKHTDGDFAALALRAVQLNSPKTKSLDEAFAKDENGENVLGSDFISIEQIESKKTHEAFVVITFGEDATVGAIFAKDENGEFGEGAPVVATVDDSEIANCKILTP
jgi:hypothetical protein